ncbi:hypothetical protein GCM10027615_64430 [Plantactinospora veratri]
MSATHSRLGAVEVNCRCTRSGAVAVDTALRRDPTPEAPGRTRSWYDALPGISSYVGDRHAAGFNP